jgi:aspartyl/asparaginyl-tRNA synthetase
MLNLTLSLRPFPHVSWRPCVIAAGYCFVCGRWFLANLASQPVEMQVQKIEVVGYCDPKTYPMAKKQHTLEHLRSHQNLRMRTNIVRRACGS